MSVSYVRLGNRLEWPQVVVWIADLASAQLTDVVYRMFVTLIGLRASTIDLIATQNRDLQKRANKTNRPQQATTVLFICLALHQSPRPAAPTKVCMSDQTHWRARLPWMGQCRQAPTLPTPIRGMLSPERH